jgi:hypothetical protein
MVEKPAVYWHMLPEYAQGRKAVWDAVNPHTGCRRIDEEFPKLLRKLTREDDMFIRLYNGSTWQVVGSDNYDRLVGTPPLGIVFSEWALADPAAWAYFAPILAENRGWALFLTTPRGRNHAAEMFDMAKSSPDWFAQLQTIDDTGVVSRAHIAEQRREYHAVFGEEAGDALIEQEYWCSWSAAVLGAYWARELECAENDGRIRAVDPEPRLPVHTSWDLGIGDATAIWWWQVAGREIRILDHYEAHGQGLEHYAKLVLGKPYTRGRDYVPQDARVRELGTGRTRIEIMAALGLDPRLVPAHKLMDGIHAVRGTLPRCWFDSGRCAKGLTFLRQYRADYDDKAKTFRDTPRHDFTSHSADAFRYLCMAWREEAADVPSQPRTLFDQPKFTLNDLFEEYEREERERRSSCRI